MKRLHELNLYDPRKPVDGLQNIPSRSSHVNGVYLIAWVLVYRQIPTYGQRQGVKIRSRYVFKGHCNDKDNIYTFLLNAILYPPPGF